MIVCPSGLICRQGTESTTRNAGLKLAEATIIAFLDHDAVPSVHFLGEHAEFHQDFRGLLARSPLDPLERW